MLRLLPVTLKEQRAMQIGDVHADLQAVEGVAGCLNHV